MGNQQQSQKLDCLCSVTSSASPPAPIKLSPSTELAGQQPQTPETSGQHNHHNPVWKNNNFKIASVHLMGAALDNEEVSKNPENILSDLTNWGTVKSGYGEVYMNQNYEL